MGQESRSAQKIMRQINVASWQNEPWTAACRHMQEKAHIQLRPCYSFLDRWSALSFSLLWLWFFDFFLSVPPVNGFDAGDQRIRTLVRLKEYVWWLAFRLAFRMRLFWQTPLLYAFIATFAWWVSWSAPLLCRHQRSRRHQVSCFHRWVTGVSRGTIE